jgi:hypothetical protein
MGNFFLPMKTTIRAATAVLFVMLGALPTTSAVDAPVSVPEEIRTCEIVPSIVDDAFASIIADEPTGFIQRVSFEMNLLSSFIDPDVGVPIYSKPVIQSTVWIDLPAGWYVGFFVGSGFDSSYPDDDFSDEIDWALGRDWELPFGMALDTSVMWCDSQDFFSSRNDVLWARARLTIAEIKASDVTIRPYAYITGLWTFGSSEFEGGVVSGVGFEGELALHDDILRLVYDFMIAYDDGTYGFQPGILTRAFVDVEYDITSHLTLRAGGTVWCPLGKEQPTETFGSVGFVVTF